MNETIANITMGVQYFSIANSGLTISIIVFIAISLTLFLLSKNFRRAIVGSAVTGGLTILGLISKSIGYTTAEGNYNAIKWLGSIIGFILVSIFIGKMLEKTKWAKFINFE